MRKPRRLALGALGLTVAVITGFAAGGAGNAAPVGPPGSAGNPLVAVGTRAEPLTQPPPPARSPQPTASTVAPTPPPRLLHAATASASEPCALVTASQASAILGAPIEPPVQAPQGPTCIYRTVGGANVVTVAVETVSVAALLKLTLAASPVLIAGRTGFCGGPDRPTLYVPLLGGHALVVSAPCAAATRLAALALPWL